ncbi:hypothetical protein B0T20DRAFT_88792 [Sordaria brevicollis]|uniref:Helix-turn-helix domain-containing protein n=1 Tax=Sordaria brevicollis TaxID=83679 RepID=A0AAE0NWA8_SORBR|nr:hypothetical protein B0T20DRAFT_88792 [Sordaria brevicollis]
MGAESSKVARKLPKNATAASIAAASRSGVPRAPPPRVNGGQEASPQSQTEPASSDTSEAATPSSTQDQFHHGHPEQSPTASTSQRTSSTPSFSTPTGSGSPLDAIGDPTFAARLRQLSATVQPNPIHSPSSTVSIHPQPLLQSQNLPPSSSQIPSSRFPSQAQAQTPSHSQSGQKQSSPQSENIPTLMTPAFPHLTSNATLTALQARKLLEQQYESEMDQFGRNARGFKGRQFLSVQMVKDVFELRKRGVSPEDVERRLGLAKGVVKSVEGGEVVRGVDVVVEAAKEKEGEKPAARA